MTQMKPKVKKADWEKRFDNNFVGGIIRCDGALESDIKEGNHQAVKLFIRQEIAQAKQEGYEDGYAQGIVDGQKTCNEMIKEAKQEVVEEIEKDLLEWYAERQAERGVRAWTDDYLSSGDTLSGTILPIIKTYLAKLKEKA